MGCMFSSLPTPFHLVVQINHSVTPRRTSAHPSQEYWSLLDGDEYGTWVDARLTELGEAQARTARSVWQKQMEMHIPAPQSYYVSPLNRCCRTAQITFQGVGLPGTLLFRPVVKEVCWSSVLAALACEEFARGGCRQD